MPPQVILQQRQPGALASLGASLPALANAALQAYQQNQASKSNVPLPPELGREPLDLGQPGQAAPAGQDALAGLMSAMPQPGPAPMSPYQIQNPALGSMLSNHYPMMTAPRLR